MEPIAALAVPCFERHRGPELVFAPNRVRRSGSTAMSDWKVWLVAFLGFATALAIGVAVIVVPSSVPTLHAVETELKGYRRHGPDSFRKNVAATIANL
jgi:hypothetical protein